MSTLGSPGSAMLSSFLALIGVRDPDAGEDEFVGTWRVEDAQGRPFEIVLSESGRAEANRAEEGPSGTWTLDGRSAVIVWATGWTTKMTRTGDGYTKTAYDTTAAAPTSTSSAEKID